MKWNFKPSKKTLQLISDHMLKVKTDKVCNIARKLNISAGTVNRYINVLECIGSVRRGNRIIIWIKDKDIPQIKPYRYYMDQLNVKKAYLNKINDLIRVIKNIRNYKEKQRIQFLLEKVLV